MLFRSMPPPSGVFWYSRSVGDGSVFGLVVESGHSLRHAVAHLVSFHVRRSEECLYGFYLQIKEGELAGVATVFIHEAASQVTSKDGA